MFFGFSVCFVHLCAVKRNIDVEKMTQGNGTGHIILTLCGQKSVYTSLHIFNNRMWLQCFGCPSSICLVPYCRSVTRMLLYIRGTNRYDLYMHNKVKQKPRSHIKKLVLVLFSIVSTVPLKITLKD